MIRLGTLTLRGCSMIQLIYVSKATEKMSEDEILDILEVSRERNKEDEITGMLLYSKEKFFQVLEGDEEKVMQTYERILKDERHKNIMLIEQFDITKRTFPDWSMGFRYLNDKNVEKLEGYSEFLDKHMEPQEFVEAPGLVVKLLYMFKDK
jgi:hypothetical protein